MNDNNYELIKKEMEHLSNNVEKSIDDNKEAHNRFLKRLDDINNFQINQPQKCGKKFVPFWVLPFLITGLLGIASYAVGYDKHIIDYIMKLHGGN